MNYLDRWIREQRRKERPGSPDEFHIRSYAKNLGETRHLDEGRKREIHCGDKTFKTHSDALAYARMEANWHGAKLIDHVERQA